MTGFERRAHLVSRRGALTGLRGGDCEGNRPGVTLVEMLVAMAISLIMMAAVANLFAVMTNSVSASRASIGLSESLRSTRNRLQADLAGATAPMLPPLRPENGDGYFEYFEGPWNDFTAYTNSGNVDTLTGDPDDVLMFTTRAKDAQPFVGKFYNFQTSQTVTVESQTAEVVWFTVQNGQSVPLANGNLAQLFTLYRRVLVVAPEYNNTAANALVAPGANTPYLFFNEYDVSARYVAANGSQAAGMVLNNLGDLTKRENRFAHNAATGNASAFPFSFPFPVLLPPPTLNINDPPPPGGMQALKPFPGPATVPAGQTVRVGEDVVLTNVLAFDVKAFDPTVPLYLASDGVTALLPSDVGYWGVAANAIGYGGFVDLGYGVNYEAVTGRNGTTSTTLSVFSGPPANMPGYGNNPLRQLSALSNFGTVVSFPTYDTWSLHYEATAGANPGAAYNNFSSTGAFSNGTNGFDDDNQNGVDDPGEFQFPPPYPAPLRGIQVKIRTYEPDSKQVREVTIVQDFVPQ